jgi:hypothetical protein
MSKIFFLRHQIEHVLWQMPFAESPSDAQIAAVRAMLEARHGTHSARGDELFLIVVAVDVIEPGATIEPPPAPRPADPKVVAMLGELGIKATAKVENP